MPRLLVHDAAFRLAQALPDAGPLMILDMAMRSADHDLDPDHLWPPSQFLDLIRRAFDPAWNPQDMLILAANPPPDMDGWIRWAQASSRHYELMVCFAHRYRVPVEGP